MINFILGIPGTLQWSYLLFATAALLLYVKCLTDLVRDNTNGLTKLVWLGLILSLPVLGIVIYYALRKQIAITLK
jgi:hypothetical protein